MARTRQALSLHHAQLIIDYLGTSCESHHFAIGCKQLTLSPALMAAVSKNLGWVSSSFDQLCIDNHIFPSLQGWLVLVPFVLVQSRCSSYYSMLQSHILSHSPNAALCSFQLFKESNVHCGVRFYHRNCSHICTKHLRRSVIDCW